MKTKEHYLLFANLLKYPGEDQPDHTAACQVMLEKNYPGAAAVMQPFTDYIRAHSLDERQELFTKTFDVQPICYLDLGYVIFGEDYKRGAFLLHMQEEQLKAENDCGTDLPDNICNMLTLFNKTDNLQLIDELAVKILIPGVQKMIGEFAQARIDLKVNVLKKMHRAIIQEDLNRRNVYKHVLEALFLVLKQDFGHVSFERSGTPDIDIQHHKSFFGKHSVNIEVNTLVNNYKLD
jgi:nitrate reductase assembly molybdenum cofactor insertion protein NarJ